MQASGCSSLVALPRCTSNTGYFIPRSRGGIASLCYGRDQGVSSRSRSTSGFHVYRSRFAEIKRPACCSKYAAPLVHSYYSTLHGTPRISAVDSKIVSNNRYFNLHLHELARSNRARSVSRGAESPLNATWRPERSPSSQNSEHDTLCADAAEFQNTSVVHMDEL